MILWRPSKGYQKENCKPLVKHKEIDMDKIQKQEHNDISKDLVCSLMKEMFLFLYSLHQKSSWSLLMTILLTQERFPLLATCYQPAYNKSIQSAFESIFYKTIPKWSITSILSCIRLELKKFNPSIGFCVQISAVKKSRESY